MRVVVGVFDSAVQAYGQPLFVAARQAAVRMFTDEVNRPAEDNGLYRHPEDFELRLLAFFDEGTGAFQMPPDGVEVLVRGKDVSKKEVKV